MRIRSHFDNVSLDEHLNTWVQPLVEQRTLGFKSRAEFFTQAARELLERYVELGLHPWSKNFPAQARKPSGPAFGVWLPLAVGVGLLGSTLLLTPDGLTGLAWIPVVPLDLSSFYDTYASLIDFLLFFLLFGSVAQVTIGQRFHHNGLAIALGLVLALTLVLHESRLGLNVRILGVYAAIILLVVLALLVYLVARNLQVESVSSFALALLIVIAGVLVYVPQLQAYVWPALLVCVAIAIFVVSSRFLGRQHVPAPIPLGTFGTELSGERATLKHDLLGITRKARKNTRQILGELAVALKLLPQVQADQAARAGLAVRLKNLYPRRHELEERLETIRQTIENLENFDLTVYKELRKKYKQLSPLEKVRAKDEVQCALDKITAGERLRELEGQLAAAQARVQQAIDQAANDLAQATGSQAQPLLQEAARAEVEASEIVEDMRTIEDLLLKITKRQLRALEKR